MSMVLLKSKSKNVILVFRLTFLSIPNDAALRFWRARAAVPAGDHFTPRQGLLVDRDARAAGKKLLETTSESAKSRKNNLFSQTQPRKINIGEKIRDRKYVT